MRRRQRGLLLLTAHRAKVLEVDHAVVLDGSWERVSRGEDVDAPRRLYYVAMTRARTTVALARLSETSLYYYNDGLPDMESDPSYSATSAKSRYARDNTNQVQIDRENHPAR